MPESWCWPMGEQNDRRVAERDRNEELRLSTAMSALIQRQLDRNWPEKPRLGWRSALDTEELFLRLVSEVGELAREFGLSFRDRERIVDEAGDVATIAMMIADRFGGLKEEDTDAQA